MLAEIRRKAQDPRDKVWGTGSKAASKDLSLFIVTPLFNLFGLSGSKTYDMFLTNRISRDDRMAVLGLHYRRQLISVLQLIVMGKGEVSE